MQTPSIPSVFTSMEVSFASAQDLFIAMCTNCLFLQLLVRSRRVDEQLTVTIIRIRPVSLGMAPAGFSGRAQHTALAASSAASAH